MRVLCSAVAVRGEELLQQVDTFSDNVKQPCSYNFPDNVCHKQLIVKLHFLGIHGLS